MQASVGIPIISHSDDPAFANFNQVLFDPAISEHGEIWNLKYSQFAKMGNLISMQCYMVAL